MESKLNPLMQSCRRAAEEVVEAAVLESQAAINRSPGNSRGYVQAAQVLKEGWRRACRAAANRLAEVKGASAPDFADELKAALEAARPAILEPLHRMSSRANALGTHNAKLAAALEEHVGSELEATLDDLSLSLADGRHVDRSKSRIISIDNRQGNGQFSFDSPGATQSVGGDMVSTGTSVEEIATLLEKLRAMLPSLSLTEAQATEIEDLVVSAEREAKSETMDQSRLKRFLAKLSAFGEQAGASAAGGILAQLSLLAANLG